MNENIENNIKRIMQNDRALKILKRDDDKHFIIVREFDFSVSEFDNPLTWFDQWNVVTDNGYNELVELLGDYINDIYDKHNNTKEFFKHVSKYARRQGLLLVPVSKFEHSSVKFTRGISQGWDSGVCGFAYLDIKDIKNGSRFSCKQRENELKSLDYALDMFTQYCNGDIYSISIYNTLTGDIIDSIGGVYEDGIKECCEELQKEL